MSQIRPIGKVTPDCKGVTIVYYDAALPTHLTCCIIKAIKNYARLSW